VEREITLRDYGRVLWGGRWLILAATVIAALVGLILTFVTETTYVATAEVYLGQATTISGTPVSTPTTNPATAPTALTGDNLVTQVARELDVSPGRVRDGVEVTAPRAPGGAVGNQPTIATVTFTDESRDVARRGANLYAEAILEQARESSAEIVDTYEEAVARSSAQVDRLERELAAYRRQLAQNPGGEQAILLQSLMSSAGQQLQVASTELAEQRLNLVKERQYGQPDIVSLARSPSSSSSLPNRARTVLLAAVIGFIVGVIVVFVWRGSPAGRAAEA
jgi:uncharacterized protein involved in exopolysaccharide biosynthesis